MEADREELRAWALLLRIPSLDHERVRRALELCDGDVHELIRAGARKPQALELPEAAHDYLRTPGWAAVDADLAWLSAPDRHLLPLTSNLFPPLLAVTAGAPVALWVRGSCEVLANPQLAIVGSRNPTAGGRETAFDFAAHLASCGLTITSGMAEGVDGAAHRGALTTADGQTVAVCGTGLNVIYPSQHAELAAEIAAHGALVSEFPPEATARREYFPQRNRIISGLSLGTLVVEAARQSGSLITARLAGEQGREVFAIPGSIHNPLTRGCHQLIRQGAKLVETAEDVLSEIRFSPLGGAAERAPPSAKIARNKAHGLDKDYEILLDALGFDALGVDTLVARSGLKPEEIASMLLILELEGLVETRPGGRYSRCPTRR